MAYLPSYSEPSKFSGEIEPTNVNILYSCTSGTNATEYDKLVKPLLIAFRNHLNTSIGKIPHPTSDTPFPRKVGDLPTEKHTLHESTNQDSYAKMQAWTLITF